MFARMKNILSQAGSLGLDTLESYLPTQFNPELKTINSLAASLALLVMADRVAEESELEDVSEFLIDMDYVIEKGLIREISHLFLKHVKTLEDSTSLSPMEFNIVVGDMLRDIALVKEDSVAKKLVADTVTLVTSGGSADPQEIKTRERILRSLGA